MRYVSGRNYRQPKLPKRRFFGSRRSRRVTHPSSHVFNPYQTKHTPVRLPIVDIPWKQLFLGSSIIAWILLLVYVPFFRITRVTYSGLQLIKKDELQTKLESEYLYKTSWWPHNNYFLVNSDALENYLTDTYTLSGAEVKKIFPNSLEVVVHEKVTSIIYDNGTDYTLVDQTGHFVRKLATVDKNEYTANSDNSFINYLNETFTSTSTATSTGPLHAPNYVSMRRNYGLFPVVYQLPIFATTTSNTDTVILRPDVLKGIIELYSALEKTSLMNPNYVIIGDPAAGAVLVGNKPWKFYFQPDDDIQRQISTAEVILRDNKPTDYIDVRFGDHVYWK